METVILIFHLIIIVTMVLVILLQRNSNDGLSGLGGGSSNPATVGVTRGSSNPLSKATAILATMFICTSLGLAYLANAKNESVIDDTVVEEINKTSKVPLMLDEKEIQKALGQSEFDDNTTATEKPESSEIKENNLQKPEDKSKMTGE